MHASRTRTSVNEALHFCLKIPITVAYLKKYENIAIQLSTILYNFANFGNYGKTRLRKERDVDHLLKLAFL